MNHSTWHRRRPWRVSNERSGRYAFNQDVPIRNYECFGCSNAELSPPKACAMLQIIIFFRQEGEGWLADYFSLGSTVKMENVGFCIILLALVCQASELRNRMFQLWQPRRFCLCNLWASAFRNFPHYFNCENIFRGEGWSWRFYDLKVVDNSPNDITIMEIKSHLCLDEKWFFTLSVSARNFSELFIAVLPWRLASFLKKKAKRV